MLPDHSDGVWFVDLAPIQVAADVCAAISNATGVGEEPGTPLLARLRGHVGQRSTLLVLDNCDHLTDAVAHLADSLVASCPHLKVLATSRQGLGVDGEQRLPVRPLTLPVGSDLKSVQLCEAARLFVDRARLVSPDFDLDAGNAEAIAGICARLDGIAVAIELAVARIGMFSALQINERLADRFTFLVGHSRALPRHQTLHATLHWSFESLPPAEQRLFCQLSVFSGGWTLPAAASVSALGDENLALALLTRLHDKSPLLVDQQDQAPARLRMLETLRDFARTRLDASVDRADAHQRHQRFFIALADRTAAQLQGATARCVDGQPGHRAGQPAGSAQLAPQRA